MTSIETTASTYITPGLASQHTLTPGQVAAMFNVNPKTVARWASSGILAPSAPRAATDASAKKTWLHC